MSLARMAIIAWPSGRAAAGSRAGHQMTKCVAPRGYLPHRRAGRTVRAAGQSTDGKGGRALAATTIALTLMVASPALAELNRFEAAAGGEFGIGSAQQFGEADVAGQDFSGQDLRRANFTAADVRRCNFQVPTCLHGVPAHLTERQPVDASWM